jgi:hypothetical protein
MGVLFRHKDGGDIIKSLFAGLCIMCFRNRKVLPVFTYVGGLPLHIVQNIPVVDRGRGDGLYGLLSMWPWYNRYHYFLLSH